MPVVVPLLALILAVVFALIGIWWGVPIVIVLGVGFALYSARARKENPGVGAMERGRVHEPSGVPRKSSADASTANERVGRS